MTNENYLNKQVTEQKCIKLKLPEITAFNSIYMLTAKYNIHK